MNVEALCVGHAAYDLTMVVDGYPAEDSKAETKHLLEAGGGPAANAAYLLSKWGVKTAFAGLIGNDPYGTRILEEFRQVGTDVSLTEVRQGHSTPVSFIIVNEKTGSRTIVNRKAAGTLSNVDFAKVGEYKPKVMLFDGHEPEAAERAMRTFPEAITVLDAGSVRPGIVELAGRVDYLVCSERFASQVSGRKNITGWKKNIIGWKKKDEYSKVLRQLRKITSKTIVVTLGAWGLIYDDGQQSGHMFALKTGVVDTTGAGDIFHGAFVYGLLKGKDFMKILQLATTTAGLSVRQYGGRPSIPELDFVEKLAERFFPDAK